MTMDTAQLLPTVGGSGLLLSVIGWLWRLLTQAERRHAAELKRVTDAHDAELRELRADVAELRTRVDTLTTALDDERKRRFEAEDNAARFRRRRQSEA